METVDVTIRKVENLYTTLTGRRPPAMEEKPEAPIATERNPVLRAEEQLERLLGALRSLPVPMSPVLVPGLRVWENDHDTLYVLDMPGVEKDSIEVAVAPGAIVVSARRAVPGRNGGGEWRPVFADTTAVEFQRVIPLAQPLPEDGITATLNNGLLEIRTPRGHASRANVPVA